MRALAEYTMRGRLQAIMSVTVLAILSLLVAPLSLLSGAAITLVTMRLGAREGILLLLASTLASSALSLLVVNDAIVALVFALILWGPMWLLGMMLRVSRSLSLTVQAALLLSAVVGMMLYLILGDPAAFWQEILREPVQSLASGDGLAASSAELDALITDLSQWITAIIIAGYFLQLLVALFIGRWWQAMIYNPGGFGQEFRQLNYHKAVALVTAPFVLIVAFGDPAEWMQALMMLLVTAYAVQGLAVLHALLNKASNAAFWLGGIYVLTFIAMPYMTTVLSMTGYADTWIGLRRKAEAESSNDE